MTTFIRAAPPRLARRVAVGIFWSIAALLLASVIVLLVRQPARAHGGFDWIRQHHGEARTAQSGGWMDGDFGGCCGKQDCFPVKATFRVKDENGKQVPGFDVHDEFGEFVPLGKPYSDVSRDPEGRHWRCYKMWGGARTEPRVGCFFYNLGGG